MIVMNPKTHPALPKCYIDELDAKAGDKISASGCANTTVWSYAWAYVWPGGTDEDGRSEP